MFLSVSFQGGPGLLGPQGAVGPRGDSVSKLTSQKWQGVVKVAKGVGGGGSLDQQKLANLQSWTKRISKL